MRAFDDKLMDAYQYTIHHGRTLWYSGNLGLLAMPSVSIIGTREPSEVGLSRTRRVTSIAVEHGFCVISGLAAGVDAVAHQTTLDLNGNTIAVMGTPIDQCYPKENEDLKRQMAERGLVLSQFPPESKVRRSNFPQRNALMAELSLMTIVTEAGELSGTRHQVKSAIRLGKPVAFLASMIDRKYEWVQEALGSGLGFVVEERADLVGFLDGSLFVIEAKAPSRVIAEPTSQNKSRPTQLSLPIGDILVAEKSPVAVGAKMMLGSTPHRHENASFQLESLNDLAKSPASPPPLAKTPWYILIWERILEFLSLR